jgi:low affinity Fe/Cu permease
MDVDAALVRVKAGPRCFEPVYTEGQDSERVPPFRARRELPSHIASLPHKRAGRLYGSAGWIHNQDAEFSRVALANAERREAHNQGENSHSLHRNPQAHDTLLTIFESHCTRSVVKEIFRRFACRAADACGSPGAFILGVSVVLIWALSGHYFHYSDTWQLVINTGTTIVTFLMVFLIQNTQNRDARAMQLKLDELIRAVGRARNELVDLENSDDATIDDLKREFAAMREKLEPKQSSPEAEPAK